MLMPIGQFAKASRLSVKSLRNYDESGLLSAAFVDPQSGYRYYRLEQLARADAIRSLRLVEMPLSAIAEALDGDDPERVLTSHLEALHHRREAIDDMTQRLQRRIHLKEFTMSNDISVRDLPAITVASHRTQPTYAEIFDAIPAGFGTVLGALNEVGVDPIGVPFTLYYQAPDAEATGDIAMCVPIASGHAPPNGVAVLDLPACSSAVAVHRGSYDDMGNTYASVADGSTSMVTGSLDPNARSI